MTMRFWNIVYKKGFLLEKIFWTMIGYFKRIGDLFRIPFYDITYVFLWGTPFGTPFYEFLISSLSKKLIYDIDDMVFLGHSSNANRFWQIFKGRSKIIYLMKKADHVITCTPKLDEFAKQYNKNTMDIPSTVDTKNKYLPESKQKNNEQIILGWSGSHSTSKYLYLLTDVLQKLSKKYNFKLIVMGDKSFHIPRIDMESFDWSESIELATLKKFDIGLYPLPDEEWVYGKSGLKAIQYMALGIPTIATAIGANYRIIENNMNGFLVKTNDHEGWKTALAILIENPQLRKQMGEKARQTIMEKYSVQSNEDKYLEIFNSLFFPQPNT
jgi:glycosyltransferase involved in cell wall biosynthesis